LALGIAVDEQNLPHPSYDFRRIRGSPLAVQLVEIGVPVVVGMAGEVSEQACRFFARRFYEGFLEGEEFTQLWGGRIFFVAISARTSVPTPFPITIGKIGNNVLGDKVIPWIANAKK
jgi:hypothetical protein